MAVEELQKACAVLSEAWGKAMVPLKNMAEILKEIAEQIVQEEEKRKICTVQKCKSHRHLPDSTRSTCTYKPVGRRNLPYQRRNF